MCTELCNAVIAVTVTRRLHTGGGFILGLEGGLTAYDPATGAMERIASFEPGLSTRPNDGKSLQP
jgi:hypothetical protein